MILALNRNTRLVVSLRFDPSFRIMDILSDDSYLSQRRNPQCGQDFYLHLSDLLLALKPALAPLPSGRVLDLGSGGSPYRSLFPKSEYRRADIPGDSTLDYTLDESNRIPADSGSFDLVLSTQVLEHVADPQAYLREAYRLLDKGGSLVLTTHGTFEEHGCPYDFRRWTADGLRSEVMAAGFQIVSCQKLTTGGRALAFLLDTRGWGLSGSRRTRFGLLIFLLLSSIRRFKRRWHDWCDHTYRDARVVDAKPGSSALFIALLVVARKP